MEDSAPNVLLLTQHFPPATNAASCRWRLLSDALLDAGYTLDVFGAAGANSWREGLEVHPAPAKQKGFGLARRLLDEIRTGVSTFRGALRAPRPAAVIATVPALGLLPAAWLVAKLRRVPLVLDLRDTWPELLGQWREWGDDGTRTVKPREGLAPLFRTAESILTRMRRDADVIVVTTTTFAEQLRAQDLKHVVVVRSIPPMLEEAPAPTPHRDLRVLYLGTVGRAQKLATAIDAAARAAHTIQLTLRIVGGGAEVDALRSYAERLGAPVEFCDRIPAEEVAAQYAWADTALVMLRNWPTMAHTVPSKLYETLSTGVHISGSVAGEAARIITEASAGTVTAPEDAQALADSWVHLAQHREELDVGSTGRAWVLSFADRTVAGERFVHAIKAVAQGG